MSRDDEIDYRTMYPLEGRNRKRRAANPKPNKAPEQRGGFFSNEPKRFSPKDRVQKDRKPETAKRIGRRDPDGDGPPMPSMRDRRESHDSRRPRPDGRRCHGKTGSHGIRSCADHDLKLPARDHGGAATLREARQHHCASLARLNLAEPMEQPIRKNSERRSRNPFRRTSAQSRAASQPNKPNSRRAVPIKTTSRIVLTNASIIAATLRLALDISDPNPLFLVALSKYWTPFFSPNRQTHRAISFH